MKLSKAYNKNLSLKEQEEKISKLFSNAKIETIKIAEKEFKIKKNENFFYTQITEKDFNFLFSFLSKSSSFSLLSLKILTELIEYNVFDYKSQSILTIYENRIENFIDDKQLITKNNIIKQNKETFPIDTTIFNAFFINKKTTNHFSYIGTNGTYNLILYRRGYKNFIFGLFLKN